jgi:hypothetical protein
MHITAIGVLASVLMIASWPQSAPGGADTHREAFTAVALSTGGPRTSPVAAQLEIVIERWSTDAERQRLLDALPRGQDAMLETLRDLPKTGYIRNPPALAWDLHYAHAVPRDEGGRRIFLATDRPIGIWEAIHRPRLIEYPFTFIELRVDEEGDGEGKLSRATKIIASRDGRVVELERYATQPVDLTEVRRSN